MEALDVRRRTYTRHRDARVALIRCAECNEYYETSVRQARRVRKGETRRLCHFCRGLEDVKQCTPDQTYKFVMWWVEESGLTRAELREIASWIYPEEAQPEYEQVPVTPAVSPIRRLPSAEGNHTNGHSVAANVLLSGVGMAINCSNTA